MKININIYKENSYLEKVIVFILWCSLCYPLFILMNYDHNINPDIGNYINDFVKENKSYDIGYEFLLLNFKSFISDDFNNYWTFYLSLQIFILSFIYRKVFLLAIALLSIIPLAAIFYGTQIRYSLASLFICLGLSIGVNKKEKYRTLFLITASFIHIGMAILIFLYFIRNLFFSYISKMNNIKFLVFLTITFTVPFIITSILNLILPYTQFYYYQNNDTYLVTKSVSSITYNIIQFLILLYLCRNNGDIISYKEIRYSLVILWFCIITSSVAVLSGRVMLFYFILEPFITFILIGNKKTRLFGFVFLFMMVFKAITYL